MSNKKISRVLSHPVAQNALSLFTVQIARYILPIITIPYLARILAPEVWGLVIFAQASAQWFELMLDYGFNLSATRQIARYRDNQEEIAKIVASVMGASLLLLLGSVLVAMLINLSIPVFGKYPDYLAWAWLIGIAQGLSPFWYFQGIERMKLPAMLDLGTRTVAMVGTLLWVKTQDDGWKVLALQAFAGLLAYGLMLGWMYRDIPWQIPNLTSAIVSLRKGWSMFLFRSSASLYTTANILILGLLLTVSQVAFFGSAERISKTVLNLLGSITQAIFPRMSYLLVNDSKRAAKLAVISIFVMGLGGLFLAVTLVITAPLVVHVLLGTNFESVIPLVRILALLIPSIAMSKVLGIQWMIPLGLDRSFNTIIISIGFINLILALSLTQKFGSIGMAWAVVISETFVTLVMYIVLWHKGLSLHQVWRNGIIGGA